MYDYFIIFIKTSKNEYFILLNMFSFRIKIYEYAWVLWMHSLVTM
jgi:hypothetical protein